MELTPKTRKEVFLAAAAGQDVNTPTPITREDGFLDAIAKSGGGGGSSGGGALVVHETVSGTTHTLDKTWQEVHDAMKSGGAVYYGGDDGVYVITNTYIDTYYFVACSAGEWVASSASGYPSYSE